MTFASIDRSNLSDTIRPELQAARRNLKMDAEAIGTVIGLVLIALWAAIALVLNTWGAMGILILLFALAVGVTGLYMLCSIYIYGKLRAESVRNAHENGSKLEPRWVTALGAILIVMVWAEMP